MAKALNLSWASKGLGAFLALGLEILNDTQAFKPLYRGGRVWWHSCHVPQVKQQALTSLSTALPLPVLGFMLGVSIWHFPVGTLGIRKSRLGTPESWLSLAASGEEHRSSFTQHLAW